MRHKYSACPNFLDKEDSCFKQLHGPFDAYFQKLHSQGVGRQINRAEILSTEEDQLRSEGVINTNTPTGLQNNAFSTVSKMFCLRGGQEHRGLQLSQLNDSKTGMSIMVIRQINRNGSFKQLRIKSKVVPLYSSPDAGE